MQPAVHSPYDITNHDNEKLLQSILENFKTENPYAEGLNFQQVKAVLETCCGIETRTIGNFFPRELGDYQTRSGNTRKVIILE